MGFFIFEKKIEMRKYFLFQLFVIASFSFGQKLTFQTLLKDKISIRAIQVWDDKVYYAGTDSKFGYASLKDTLDKKQIKLSEDKLQFRTLSQDHENFYAINIGSPANFYQINKNTFEYKVIHKDETKNAFYDVLYFYKNKFYTFSDPESNLNLKLAEFSVYNKQFHSKYFSDYKMNEGEAAFAASNSNISAKGNFVWLATGGKSSRIFRLNLKTQKIEVFKTPFIQGTSSQGIYSIDFHDTKFGIAVGGDYTKQAENINNIATTHDGGVTWQIEASGKNGGYKTCVKFRPGSKGKEIIAVGDQNIEFSNDYGKTWTTISEEKNLYICEWVNKNTLVFAGKDKILKASISDISKK